jgi:hypothetical protein
VPYLVIVGPHLAVEDGAAKGEGHASRFRSFRDSGAQANMPIYLGMSANLTGRSKTKQRPLTTLAWHRLLRPEPTTSDAQQPHRL